MTVPSPPPGWFPDPLGRHEYRYFNGSVWTGDVADGGNRFVDPLGAASGGDSGGSNNGLATAAITCGIIACFIAWIPFIVVPGFVLAVLAVVFGFRGLARSRSVGRGRATSIAGLATGGLAIGLSIVGVWLSVIVYREVVDFIEPGPVVSAVPSCDVVDGRVRVEGSVSNRSDDTRDYTVFVTVTLDQPASDSSLRQLDDVVEVDRVSAGSTAPWTLTLDPIDRSVPDDEQAPGCTATVEVLGPFPFDVEMDYIER